MNKNDRNIISWKGILLIALFVIGFSIFTIKAFMHWSMHRVFVPDYPFQTETVRIDTISNNSINNN